MSPKETLAGSPRNISYSLEEMTGKHASFAHGGLASSGRGIKRRVVHDPVKWSSRTGNAEQKCSEHPHQRQAVNNPCRVNQAKNHDHRMQNICHFHTRRLAPWRLVLRIACCSLTPKLSSKARIRSTTGV